MRTINHIMICGAALLLLAGCTSDLSLTGHSGEQPLRLSVSPTTGLTRASDGLYTSSSGFGGGEQVEVYVNNSSTHGTYQVNSTTTTKLDATGDDLYYPTSGTTNLYAVYPAASAKNGSHTVKYDQTSDDNYKQSDLMYAKTTVSQANKTNEQQLSFGHQLVKLKVKIIKAAGVSAVTKVEMKNVKRRVTVSADISSMTLGTPASAIGETGTGANTDKILIFQGSNTSTTEQTYACVFPDQDWSNADFITVTADGKEATYKLTKNDFTFGHEYTLTLNINARALGNTVNITNWTNTDPQVVQPTVEKLWPGALPGKFSVAANKKVYFSQGNLRATYNGSSWTWSFAENQWDYIGNATGNTKVTGSSPFINENATVDLFGWVGASSTWTGVAQYGISFSTATNNTNGYGNNASESLKSDWGNLAISNGGGVSNSGWFTLTNDEWLYLFGMTSNNSETSGHARYRKYFRATVNSVQGIVVLPDEISGISDIPAESSRGKASTFGGKTYTTAAWSALESSGAVFLPAAGYRNGTTVNDAGSHGYYWSSSPYTSYVDYAYRVYFNSGGVNPANYHGRFLGLSVRLVRVAP